MKYRITRNYSSGRAGPWKAGDIVNLDDNELIAWLGRDAPGLLEPYKEMRVVEQPPQDRMVRKGRTRGKKNE